MVISIGTCVKTALLVLTALLLLADGSEARGGAVFLSKSESHQLLRRGRPAALAEMEYEEFYYTNKMKNNLRLKPSIVTTSRGQHVTAEALPGSDSSSLLRSSSKTPPLQQQQQQLDATSSYPEQ